MFCLCIDCALGVGLLLFFCGVEHELLHRSMSSIMSCPFWDEFLPLSRQLGIEVEVELEVDLE